MSNSVFESTYTCVSEFKFDSGYVYVTASRDGSREQGFKA